MTGTPITIVGGGVFVVSLCQALASHPTLASAEVRLVAQRHDRLQVIAAACQRLVDGLAPGWRVRATESLAEGCDGAGLVVMLLRAGGLAARSRDESFPRAFGLTGDEGLGPGGMANALRTVPVLAGIAASIARVAPEAWILNMVAPLGITTRVLLDHGLRTIGVCELPTLTERALRAALPCDADDLHYAGFNHLGWFWAEGDGAAALARAAVDIGLVDRETVTHFGAVPLRYYLEIFAPDAAARLGFARSPRRAEQLLALSERAFPAFCDPAADALAALDGRPTPWFDNALVPIIAALSGRAGYDGFANVRNEGRLSLAPDDATVELRTRIAGGQVDVSATGAVPAPAAQFLGAVGRSETFLYEAAMSQDVDRQKRLLVAALKALPLPLQAGQPADLASEIIDAAGHGT